MKRCARQWTLRVAALTALVWVQGTLGADWASTIISANPLNWFRFDDLSGTVAQDEGSANMDGTYVGSVGLGQPGLVGYAVAFDAGSHVFLGQPNVPTDWTLETIFKADTVTGGVSMGLVGTDFAAASDRMALKAEQWNSTGQMGYTRFSVVDVTFADSQAATPADFAHVVFVGQNSGVSLYVNGSLAESATTSTPLARWAIGAGAIRADGTPVDPLTGMIDELVIYNRALSPEEISAHYYSTIPEPTVVSLGVLGGLLLLTRCRRRP